MGINEYVKKKKNVYTTILQFLEKEDESRDYGSLFNSLEKENVSEDRSEFSLFLRMISRISENHFCCQYINTKIEEIIQLYSEKIKQTFTDFEIFCIFRKNKRILLFLFKKGLVEVNNLIANILLNKKKNFEKFFYPEIKDFLTEEERERIEGEIIKAYPDFLNDFDKMRTNGINESRICALIRADDVDDFQDYITKSKKPISEKINASIFETNPFLVNKELTLIEYAAFYGSSKIFKYLQSKIEMNPSLWLYAIHSKNANIITLLEKSNVEPPDKNFEKCINESIKCHHNEIADYFIDKENKAKADYLNNYLKYHNYDINSFKLEKLAFTNLCKYGYIFLVKVLLNNNKITDIIKV